MNKQAHAATRTGVDGRAAPGPQAATANRTARRISMHEGIGIWCDCCSCEAEPRWLEVAEEMGIDLGGDYENDGEPGSPQDSR